MSTRCPPAVASAATQQAACVERHLLSFFAASTCHLLNASACTAAYRFATVLLPHIVQGGTPSAARLAGEAQGLCPACQGLPQEGGHHQGELGLLLMLRGLKAAKCPCVV